MFSRTNTGTGTEASAVAAILIKRRGLEAGSASRPVSISAHVVAAVEAIPDAHASGIGIDASSDARTELCHR